MRKDESMANDMLSRISQMMPDFSKGQKLIGRFILDHYDKAAFMTASKLGKTVGVSESTVVRFASEIGFDGYPQLQRSLQEMIRNRLTAVQRMEITSEQIGPSDLLSKVLNLDIEKIKRTLEETDINSFNQAVESILGAKRIYIIGIRSASALAGFLSYYFSQIFEDVRYINTSSTSEAFEQMRTIGREDVLIGITFPRYSKRAVSAARFAKDSGSKVVAITDSISSPIAAYSDSLLLARSDMASFVDSLVAPLSLINALIVAIGLKRQDEITKIYSELEQIWDEYDVYEKAKEPGR